MMRDSQRPNPSAASSAATLTVALPPRLDVYTTSDLWIASLKQLKTAKPGDLVIDATAVEFCDAAGAALLTTLKQHQCSKNKTAHIIGLKQPFQELIADFERQTQQKTTTTPRADALTRVGRRAQKLFKEFSYNILYARELLYQAVRVNRQGRYLRWNDVVEFIEKAGPDALPITALLGFLFGLILSFQGVVPLQNFGADIYIIRLVGTSIIRELAPLIVSIIVIARTASAFAAEIGTMKINREIDALVTMGIEPIRYLVLPRVIAVVVMMPALTIFLILFSFIGCYIVASSLGYSFPIFMNELYQSFSYVNILNSLLKSVIFGLLIASIGCLHGLKTKSGAVAVGESTTRAVVSGIIILTVTDGIFSVIFYCLGI